VSRQSKYSRTVRVTSIKCRSSSTRNMRPASTTHLQSQNGSKWRSFEMPYQRLEMQILNLSKIVSLLEKAFLQNHKHATSGTGSKRKLSVGCPTEVMILLVSTSTFSSSNKRGNRSILRGAGPVRYSPSQW